MVIDEPFEYLSIGGTFVRAYNVASQRLGLFVSIGAIVLVLLAVFNISSILLLTIWYLEEERIPNFEPKHIPLVILVFGLQFVIYEMASILGRATIMRAVAKMYLGESASVKECFQDVWMKKTPLLSTFAVIGAGLVLAISVTSSILHLSTRSGSIFVQILLFPFVLAALAGFVYLYTGLCLAYPSIVVENFRGPLQGIKRSWDLSAGSRCYIGTVLFCLWLLNYVISWILQGLFKSKGHQDDILDIIFDIPSMLMSLLPVLIYFPMHATLETVMYLNLRIGRESMNLQVLTGDLASTTSTNAAQLRNGYAAPTETMTDYRQVPLIDQDGEPPFVGLVTNEIA